MISLFNAVFEQERIRECVIVLLPDFVFFLSLFLIFCYFFFLYVFFFLILILRLLIIHTILHSLQTVVK